jgi:hypothetical protein
MIVGIRTRVLKAYAAQPAKPMFAELIAKHEGLAEELAAMDGPAWQDAPNKPGLWLNSYTEEGRQISAANIAQKSYSNGRWFGPISPDTEDAG